MAVINILEDDEVIRGQLSQLLRDKGYEVIENVEIAGVLIKLIGRIQTYIF